MRQFIICVMVKTLRCVFSKVCSVITDFVPGSVCHCVSVSPTALPSVGSSALLPPQTSNTHTHKQRTHTPTHTLHIHIHITSQLPRTWTLSQAHWAPLKGSHFETDTPLGSGAKQCVCVWLKFSNKRHTLHYSNFSVPQASSCSPHKKPLLSTSLYILMSIFEIIPHPTPPWDVTFPPASISQLECVSVCARLVMSSAER